MMGPLLAWADSKGNYQTLESHLNLGLHLLRGSCASNPFFAFVRRYFSVDGVDLYLLPFLHHDDGKAMVGYQTHLFKMKDEGMTYEEVKKFKPIVRHEVLSAYYFLHNYWKLRERGSDWEERLALMASAVLLHHDSMLVSIRLKALNLETLSRSWLTNMASLIHGLDKGKVRVDENALNSLHNKLYRTYLPRLRERLSLGGLSFPNLEEEESKRDFVEKMEWLIVYMRRPVGRIRRMVALSQLLHAVVIADNYSAAKGRGEGTGPKVMNRIFAQLRCGGGENGKR